MLEPTKQAILSAERDKAAAQEQRAAFQRSQQEGEALRRQQEETRQRQDAECARINQQKQQATMAILQADRTKDWYKMPIGK